MNMFRGTVTFLALLATCCNAANPCIPRIFGHDSIVCVCNETQCDSLDPLSKTEFGTVQVFESSRSGKRLEERSLQFNNTLEGGDNYLNVVLDRSTKFQEIIGFGGAWSDAAAIGIGSMSESLKDSILRAYFSNEGIEYSTARVVVGGSDFSTRPYTYDDLEAGEEDWNLDSWSLAQEDTDYKIPQIEAVNSFAAHPIKYFAASWSPPAWLKNNNDITHGGQIKGRPGSEHWKTYAKYWLRFLDAYKEHGVQWWGMSVQNEPVVGWDPNFAWNSCGINAEMERDFVKTDLGPILEEGGYSPETFTVMAYDFNRPFAETWANVAFADVETAKWIKGLAVHWFYYGTAGPYDVYDSIHEKFPEKFILATEACNRDEENPTDRIALGKWSLAEEYAHDIILDLLHWVGGWTDWNMVLDMQGGPNWANNFFSAPIIVNPEAGEYYKNVQFYAIAHFSKFLTPGSRRISTTSVEEQGSLELAAFERPDGGIVVIVVNARDEDQFFNLSETGYGELKVKVEAHSFSSWLYY